MSRCNGTLIWTVLTSLLMVGVASAGPLPTDPNALPLWQGETLFTGANVSATKTLHAKVQYAVYAPGTYSTSAALDTPVDPSGGTHYVYAYEVFHLITGDATTVANLSVDLVTGAVPNSSTWIGHDLALPEGGVTPTSSNLINGGDGFKDNAKWNFIAPVLGSGNHSDILIFTSQYEPHWRVSSMQGGSTTLASQWLPSPIPEPTTYALAMIGVLSLVSVRCLRRRIR